MLPVRRRCKGWSKGRRRVCRVGTAKVIHEVSSLKEVIIPGRVHEALHVQRKSPLRVFADQRNRVVLGGCSPIKRLNRFTQDCTRTLTRAARTLIYVASQRCIVTTTKAKGGRIRKRRLDRRVRRVVRGHDAIIGAKRRRTYSVAGGAVSALPGKVILSDVLYGKSYRNTIVLTSGDKRGRALKLLGTLSTATTGFLKGGVRR